MDCTAENEEEGVEEGEEEQLALRQEWIGNCASDFIFSASAYEGR